MNWNWSGLALLALEYLPTWIDFAKKEEPAVADFIAKAKGAIHASAPPVAGAPQTPTIPGMPADLGALLQDLSTKLSQLKFTGLPPAPPPGTFTS